MKRLLTLFMVGALMLTFVGCGNSSSQSESQSDNQSSQQDQSSAVSTIESPLALLNTVWASYADDEKFPAAGGDFSEENMTNDAPGKYGIADAEALDATFGLPSDSVALIDDAASLMHMMNANTFTCGAFHVKNSDDITTLANSLKENILKRQWMCGFPDKLVIITVEDYVVSAFGNQEIMDTFKTKTLDAYETATVAYEEAIR